MASDAQQQRSDRILQFLISKGLHGCPICAQGRFSVGPEHVIISTPDPNAAEGAPVEGSAVVLHLELCRGLSHIPQGDDAGGRYRRRHLSISKV